MAILIATAAATVNMFMALYNITKDVFGLSKHKIRHAKSLENHKDSLQWKKKSLQRSRAGASRKADRFGTETIRLHNQWTKRVDKVDAKLDQYLASCENAKSFHKRAQLGKRGSVLEKEVERVEADAKIFYNPSYRTRVHYHTENCGGSSRYLRSVRLDEDTSSLQLDGDTRTSSNSWNGTGSNSSSWNSGSISRSSLSSTGSSSSSSLTHGSSRNMSRMVSTGYSTSSGRSSSNRSTIAVTGSPTWSTLAVHGNRSAYMYSRLAWRS